MRDFFEELVEYAKGDSSSKWMWRILLGMWIVTPILAILGPIVMFVFKLTGLAKILCFAPIVILVILIGVSVFLAKNDSY